MTIGAVPMSVAEVTAEDRVFRKIARRLALILSLPAKLVNK